MALVNRYTRTEPLIMIDYTKVIKIRKQDGKSSDISLSLPRAQARKMNTTIDFVSKLFESSLCFLRARARNRHCVECCLERFCALKNVEYSKNRLKLRVV